MESSVTLFRVRGIPIGINWSWLLIAALLTWILGSALFPATHPGETSGVYLAMAIVAVILFFLSVLGHELAHALVGVREGVKIEGITLWLLGGVARFVGGVNDPRTEFRMTIVGPFTSLALAGVFGGLGYLGSQAGLPGPVVGVLEYLGTINLILALFNMVPAMPLDGGRILRSWLWKRQQDRVAATRSATRAGRAFGWMMIWIGLLGFFTGAGIGGFWLILLGWFVQQAAAAEGSAVMVQETFRGRRVRDLMSVEPDTVDADWTVERFVDEVGRPGGHSTYPVVEGGRMVGLMSLRAASQVPPEERPVRRVSDAMLPRDEVPVLRPDAPAEEALELLQQQQGRGPGRAIVTDNGQAQGIVSMSDIMRAVELEKLRGPTEPRQPVRRSGILVWVVVVLIMALAAGYLYHPPAAVLAPGPAIDVAQDISIDGIDTTPINGRYVATPVTVQRANALGTILAAFDPSREVVSLTAVFPGGDPTQVGEEQRELFAESQLIAAAAAASAAGLAVTLDGTGARILDVVPDTPADGVLEPGDVIVAVDGRPISLANDLRDALTGRRAGTQFTVSVERGGIQQEVEIRTQIIGGQGAPAIGVIADTRGLDVDLPFDVEFAERAVGGQSAGLPYALAMTDLLSDDDIAGGRTIAASGAIDVNGNVGPVGGIPGKVESARQAGADVFLIPAFNVGDLPDTELDTSAVDTLTEALRILENAGANA
jgi:PDZ domain-containing secreted protein/Zn-dependent protease/CBS domain-containing protein